MKSLTFMSVFPMGIRALPLESPAHSRWAKEMQSHRGSVVLSVGLLRHSSWKWDTGGSLMVVSVDLLSGQAG